MIRKMAEQALKFIDIGVNLTDPMFRGIYHGKKAHADDFEDVLQRSRENGVRKMIITAGRLSEAQEALELAKTSDYLYCTVGCHPTRCKEFEENGKPEEYYDQLIQFANENQENVVAIGECGLDYDREHFCPRETQLKYFEKQFSLAEETKLPMFLHMRSACQDFVGTYKQLT